MCEAATTMTRTYLGLVTMLCIAQCAFTGEAPKRAPGDVIVDLCPSDGGPCFGGLAPGDPGKPRYGNLITGRYSTGEFMCDDGHHPVQGPRDVQAMQEGQLGFHCEADTPPPLQIPTRHMTGSTLIAWWGAVLSTLLALIKLWEFWRDRFQVEVSHNFTGNPEIGNEILVRNLSGRTFILAYWELLYGAGRWPTRRFSPLTSPEYFDVGDVRVKPHSTYTLTFTDENHFDWGVGALKGRRIFIRLYIAGRRPIVRLVYAP
jgi:hypothetical protein